MSLSTMVIRRTCVVVVTANSWQHAKIFLSVAPRRSISIAGVGWLYQPWQFIVCVVVGWLHSNGGVESAFSNDAQRLFEWDRGAGGFFEWGRQLAVGLFSGALQHGVAENSVVQLITGSSFQGRRR